MVGNRKEEIAEGAVLQERQQDIGFEAFLCPIAQVGKFLFRELRIGERGRLPDTIGKRAGSGAVQNCLFLRTLHGRGLRPLERGLNPCLSRAVGLSL